ncbi:hypothetical protein B9479_002931 [Cryptococcus floricola]|uniref:Uncharacterized protein n=1 Tax=Cryptococcus floricola TaxID=2591691 RepID=A0A5D3B2E6_9TREE|nr:hypothetical protein B9479_002931 [Cryptococcus floricola]
MAKRKRDSLPPTASPAPTASPSAAPDKDEGTAHVVVQLADGSKAWRGKLKPKRTFDQWVPKIVERLGVNASPELRVLHVRDGGKEVEILDDFDFSALKSRAASATTPLTVKIYTPSTSNKKAALPQTPTPAAASKTPNNTPATVQKSKKKGKGEVSTAPAPPSTPATSKKNKEKAKAIPQPDLPPVIQTDRPSQPSPAPPIAPATKTKKRKRDSTSSNVEEAPACSTPGPSQHAQGSKKSPSPTQPKKKPRKRASQVSSPPASPAQKAPTFSLNAPSPATATGNPFQFSFSPANYNKYKPAKPSPLGRMDNPMESQGEKETEKDGKQKARKPRKKKEKAAAASEASSVAKAPEVPIIAPVSTPAKETSVSAPAPSTPATPDNTTPSKTRKPRAKATPKPTTPNVTSEIMRKHREKLAAEAAAQAAGISAPEVSTPSRDEAPAEVQAQVTPKGKTATKDRPAGTTSSTPASAPAPSQPSTPTPKSASKASKGKAPAKPKPGPRASLAAEIAAQILRETQAKEATAEAAKEKELEKEAEGDAMEVDAPAALSSPNTGSSSSNTSSLPEPSTPASGSGKKTKSKKVASRASISTNNTPNHEDVEKEAGDANEHEEPQGVAETAERQPEVEVERAPDVSNEGQADGDLETRAEERVQEPVAESTQVLLPPPKQPECIICQGLSHPQVECEVVKAGIPRLRQVLAERCTEENSEAAVKAIEMWIQRLGRVANAVTGASPKPSTPKRVDSPKTTVPAKTPIVTPHDAPTSNRKAVSESSASDVSKSPTPPLVPPTPLPELPPIYHKALSRKAGPGSAISVSDAVIETGSSASDTESESESDSTSSSGDEGSRSDGSTRSTRARSSSASSSSSSGSSRDSPSPPPPDLSSLDPGAALRHFLTAPLSQKQRRAARDSAAHMQAPGIDDEDEPQVASDVDSEEERRANGSFHRGKDDDEESLVDGYGLDEDEKEDESVVDEEEHRNSVPVVTPNEEPGQGDERAKSVEDIEESQSFETPAAVATQVEDIEQESEPMDVDTVTQFPSQEGAIDGDIQTPPDSSQLLQTFESSRQSFSDLAALASPGAPPNELPGDIAIRDTINEEDPSQRVARDEPSIEIHISSSNNGPMSPPASAPLPLEEDSLPATQMIPETQLEAVTPTARFLPTRRSTRQLSRQPSIELERSPDLRPAVTFQVSHVRSGIASSPPLDLPPSSCPLNSQPDIAPPTPSRRRLRSASRDPPPPEAAPAPRSRSTRSSSRQLEVPSTPQPPVRRSTRVNASQSNDVQASQPEPAPVPTRRSSRRQTTPLASSQVDQLDPSSPPANQAEVVEESPLFIAETQPNGSQGESQESQTQKDIGRFWKYGGSQESPLFMSQGSQYPQTQAYNIYPTLESSDTDATPKAKTAAPESSPTDHIGDARKNGTLRMGSPIIEEEEEEEGASHKDDHGRTPTGEDQSMEQESDASDDEVPINSIPIPRPASQPSQSVYPTLRPLPHPASQGSSFPTLSSLPRDVLRGFTSMFASPSKPQPESSNKGQSTMRDVAEQMQGVGGDDSESETSGDSSEEEQEPEKLRGRFAGTKAKKAKAKPVVQGW